MRTKNMPATIVAGMVGVVRKPGSVSGVRYLTPDGDHSSGTFVAECLKRPTQELGRAALKRSHTWSCSGWGLPCHNCCQLRGGLLPHHFTLARDVVRRRGRFIFCGTFLEVTLTGRYPASCPTEPGLSSRGPKTQSGSLNCADGTRRTRNPGPPPAPRCRPDAGLLC